MEREVSVAMTNDCRATWRSYFVFAPRTLTLASVTLLTAICFIGWVIFNGLLLDFLGFPINSGVVLIATLLELALIFIFLLRRRVIRIMPEYDELFGFLLIVGMVSAYIIFPSLPGGLPPSHHFDAVNHVLLANFIYDHNALPHDMTGAENPYFMNWYPAGGALLAAVVSHWMGSIPFRMLHSIASVVLGLSAGLVFVLTNRLLPDKPISRPISMLSTMLLFTSWNYFPGLVNERYVYAQVISQFFALAAFFSAYMYLVEPDLFALLLTSFSTGIILVSHPTALVVAIAAALGTILLHPRISRAQKIVHVVVFVVGLLPTASIYVIQHIQYWTKLTGYGEAVPLSFDTIGLFIPTLGVIGIGFVIRSGLKHEQCFPLLLVAAVLFQPIVLLSLRPFIQGIDIQFFERSIYILIYPLAMLSAFPLLKLGEGVRAPFLNRDSLVAYWVAVLAISVIILLTLPPRPFAPLTLSEFTAASWAKQNLDVDNIAIISPIREDAYWIHLVIFNHSPSDPLTTSAYNLGSMDYAEWRGNPGMPDYAIVRNTERVPSDPTVTTVYRVDESAVLLKPRGSIVAPPALQYETNFRFGDMFDLIGYDLAESFTPGESMPVTFYWRPLRWPSARVAMFVQVLNSSGDVVARSENEMFQKRFPTQRWPINSVVMDTWQVFLPTDLNSGDYTLEIAIFDQYTGNRFDVSGSSPDFTDRIGLGPIRVVIPPPLDAELKLANHIDTRFGNGISLLAYSVGDRNPSTGGVFELTLYWQRVSSITHDYTVFVHLLDSSGHLVAQVDAPPQNGTYPTSAWQTDEVVKDPYHLKIPKDISPGDYKIEIGLYTPVDLKRIPVANSDHIVLPLRLTVK